VKLFYQVALVAIGSALGGLARWGVGLCAARYFGTGFPWGTFLINITGCLLLGWFSTVITEQLLLGNVTRIHPDDLRLIIAVGFTGAYTTFSTFEFESNTLFQNGEGIKGFTYLAASVLLGLLAVRIGIGLAHWK
jgi:CrcB protein